MKIEKTKNASRNITFGILLKIYQIFLPFLMRTIMMYTIGVQYLGLNSLFSSILQVLNLAELGVGSAMVFSMYKPIAEDDEITICALLKLYRLYYRIIGAFILIVGLLLTPALPKLISGDIPADMNVYILYLLNLLATVLTYWLFAYRNSILQAFQRTDVISKITIGTETIKYMLQFGVLIIWKNYYYFVMVLLLTQIINNIATAIISKKMFPNLNPLGNLDKDKIRGINRKIKDLFTSKLGYTIVSSADTIVISAFLGLTVLAKYQNYYYILNAIIGFMSIIYSSITAGIGNSMLTKSLEDNFEDFKTFTLLVSFVSGLCCACFLTLYQPFMMIWMGKDMLLSDLMVVLLCFYFWFYELVMMISVYKDAGGIWHEDRFRPLISGVANLLINLILVKFIGLYGIVLSTIISILFISLPWIIKNVNNMVFHRKSKCYFYLIVKNTIIIICSCIVVYIANSFITINGIWGLIVRGLVACLLSSCTLLIFFRNDEKYEDAKLLLLRLLKIDRLLKR